jgi:hypothetical protein
MRARDLTALLTPAVLLLGSVWLAAPAFAAVDKVTICNIPLGNPENVQIIDVSNSALQKHIDRHGELIFDEAGQTCDRQDNGPDRQVHGGCNTDEDEFRNATCYHSRNNYGVIGRVCV